MSTAASGRPHVPQCVVLGRPAEALGRPSSGCAIPVSRLYALIRVNGRLVVNTAAVHLGGLPQYLTVRPLLSRRRRSFLMS